jgi:hypothetical protein
MSMRAEVLRDRPLSRKAPLGVARGLEPLHVPLPLACGLVRGLRTIIQIPMVPMFHPREDLALSSSVARKFVGHDPTRHVRQSLEQLTDECLCSLLIAAALNQDVQDGAVLIYGPPQRIALAFDRQKQFIHMPLIARPWPSPPKLIGRLLATLAAPRADSLIGYAYATLKQ